MSKLDSTLEPTGAVHRIEVISGTGRRRRFSTNDKARIVEETLAPGAVVSEVARRHGLTPQQVFTWRRQARQPEAGAAATEAPLFVPAVVETASPSPEPVRRPRRPRRDRRTADLTGTIALEIDGVSVRIGAGAEAGTVAAVIRALRARP
ncbi:IS66-like element accessory protein TnpA [Rhodovulum sp. PH10]|uniref:IS66-like element accessory protein TnpA n=1 Tax=Rhodovulum sp. PH10 TaxID=1187851 RepID=UPI00058E3340|nr:transposase [Rhodovulum sp. PH10]